MFLCGIFPQEIKAQTQSQGVVFISKPVSRDKFLEGVNQECIADFFAINHGQLNRGCGPLHQSLRSFDKSVGLSGVQLAQYLYKLVEGPCPSGNATVIGTTQNQRAPAMVERRFESTANCLYTGGSARRLVLALHPGFPVMGQAPVSATIMSAPRAQPSVREVETEVVPVREAGISQKQISAQPPAPARSSSVVNRRPAVTSAPASANASDLQGRGRPFAPHDISRRKSDLVSVLALCVRPSDSPGDMIATCGQILEALHQRGLALTLRNVSGLAVYFNSLEEVDCLDQMHLIGLTARGEIDWKGIERKAVSGEQCLRERDTKRFVVSLYCVNATVVDMIIPDPVVVAQKLESHEITISFPDSVIMRLVGKDSTIRAMFDSTYTGHVRVRLVRDSSLRRPVILASVKTDTVEKIVYRNQPLGWRVAEDAVSAVAGAIVGYNLRNFPGCPVVPGGPVNPPSNLTGNWGVSIWLRR